MPYILTIIMLLISTISVNSTLRAACQREAEHALHRNRHNAARHGSGVTQGHCFKFTFNLKTQSLNVG
jgi:hypothetical protein